MGCLILFFIVIGFSGLANSLLFFPIGIVWGLPMAFVGFGGAAILIKGNTTA